ncbi:MAG: PadR family transcriptional regulator [Planctomycetota bacterium]
MSNAFSKDLIAASAVPLVLSILKQGDSYGYAIIQSIKTASGGQLEWSEGMLYPVLHRLEAKGLVKAYWGQSETGRKRKYYALAREGREELDQSRQAWADMFRILQTLDKEAPCSN